MSNCTVNDILQYLEEYMPCGLKMDFDNVGLLAGRSDRNVEKVLISLDITEEVIEEAKAFGAQLIVSHHPMFFSLKNASDKNAQGQLAVSVIESQMSAICMHTNLDVVSGGVNDMLARALSLSNIEHLEISGIDQRGEAYGIGRIGEIPKSMTMSEFLPFVSQRLKTAGLRYYDSGRNVKFVAVGGGSCGDYLMQAFRAGCDTFISADLKYNVFLDAKQIGINLIDADHFCTENVVCPYIMDLICSRFPDIEVRISEVHGQTARFFVE